MKSQSHCLCAECEDVRAKAALFDEMRTALAFAENELTFDVTYGYTLVNGKTRRVSEALHLTREVLARANKLAPEKTP